MHPPPHITHVICSGVTNRLLPAGACIRKISQAHVRDGSTGRGAGGVVGAGREKKARSGRGEGRGGWRGGLVVHRVGLQVVCGGGGGGRCCGVWGPVGIVESTIFVP
jgi:hypothetical protein